MPSALGTDYYIDENSGSYLDLSNVGLQPGDTIWLEAHTRERLQLLNLNAGTAENPILITNTGGQFIISSTDQKGFEFHNSKHFIIQGTAGQGYDYGIKIAQTGLGPGINMLNGTSDFEICYVEICNTSFAGIEAKSTNLPRSEFVMENVKIHDNYIHDTDGEGMYIGDSFYDTNNTVHECHNIEIYDNYVEDCGWDGIQLGSGTEGCSIHDNIIIGCGGNTTWTYQKSCMRLNPGTCGLIYNNYIDGGPDSLSGINANPHDDMYIFNNVIIDSPNHGIYIGNDQSATAGMSIHIMNNTIVSPATEGIEFRSLAAAGNLFYNNIICDPGIDYVNLEYDQTTVTQLNNLYVSTVAAAGFADAGNDDYTLAYDSDAVDTGANVFYYGIDEDIDGNSRPQGTAYDIGAYEYYTAGNDAPAVSAGDDQTVTLPHEADLDGDYADDGLPNPPAAVTLTWTKQSGPGTVTFDDDNAVDTEAEFSVSGTYVLRLTAYDGSYSLYDEVTITARDNTAPEVDAGGDQAALVSTALSLDATVTDDGYPDPPASVDTTWTKQSGPGSVTFGDDSAVDTTATFSATGTYVLRLTADDDEYEVYDEITVGVYTSNSAPTVDAGSNQTVTHPNPAALDATVSDEGLPNPPSAYTVAWSKVSGPGAVSFADANAVDTTATFESNGTYVLRLTADDSDLDDYDDVTITVEASSPSNLVVLVPYDWGQVGAIYCAADGAFDDQPTWDDQNDEPTGDDANPNEDTDTNYADRHFYIDFGPNYGIYRITQTWTRYRPNSPGSYSGFGSMWWDDDTDETNDGTNETTLDWQASQSVPSSGSQLWVQDVDASSSVVTPQARYLIINTGSAPSNRPNEFCMVGYTDVTNVAPSVDAGSDDEITLPTDSVSLDATVTDDDLPDPPAAFTVLWTKQSGPGTVTFDDDDAVDTDATFSAAGTYVLRLTANDSALSAYDEVTVIVNEASGGGPSLEIITPVTWGTASGSDYCSAAGAFDDQPTWDSQNEEPTGDDTNPNEDTDTNYANRHFYIDLGADYDEIRIVGTWTRYRPYSPGDYDGFPAMWWDDDNDTTNDGTSETTLDWAAGQGVSSSGSQLWVQDVDCSASPITPQGRYLVVSSGSAPSGRPNEFCIVGYTVGDNVAPSVDVGSDQSIVILSEATLDATVTDDDLPDPPAAFTVLWTKTSGPGTVTFDDDEAVDTTATFSAAGTYVLRLTADDDELTAYDELTVTVIGVDIITPDDWGTASGSSYCSAAGAFDDQPTWDSQYEEPTGDDSVPNEDTDTNYANRHFYIDFGTSYADIRIISTWTRYRPYSAGDYDGFPTMWWDDDNDTTNDGTSETTLNWAMAQGVPATSSQLWEQDVDCLSSPITPQGRYLVVSTGSAPSARPNEFCIVGYIDD